MKIYIDSEYRCHTTNPDSTFREVNVDFFNGKCSLLIEGYRYIPSGESWTRSDGRIFKGEMIAPWKPYSELDAAQLAYELSIVSEYSSVLSEIEAAISAPEVHGTTSTIAEVRKQNIITRINDMINILTTSSTT